jgi:ribosome biogenesis GTPase
VIAEVIATYGRHLLVRDATGTPYRARPMGRKLDIVCGDQVKCRFQGEELLVEQALPRKSVLRRSTLRGRSEALAANLTQMAIVLAPLPAPDLFLVDRYLCAAECAGIAALLVLNKADLDTAGDLQAALGAHAALGYRLVSVCALRAQDVALLSPHLAGHTTILVGQSGVGKSSLVQQLVPDAAGIAIGDLVREEEGRHTTTASRLHDGRGGARIIDSPGVRDYAPAIEDLEHRALGFREVARLESQCRFADCRHLQEPGCAVRDAVASGTMDARRYESYRRLRRLHEKLWERRPQRERAARPR